MRRTVVRAAGAAVLAALLLALPRPLAACSQPDGAGGFDAAAVAGSAEGAGSGGSVGAGADGAAEDAGGGEPSAPAADRLQEAVVSRVVDGDTFVADVGGSEERVRLVGVDTPESVHPDEDRNTEEGKLASEHTSEILPAGTVVWLEADVSDRDRYGRLLRYVWLAPPADPDDEAAARASMLNARLVAEGWADAAAYPPDIRWSALFESLQAERG